MPYSGNPNWPPNFQTGTVFGRYVDFGGNPVEGTLTFRAKATSVVVTNDATVVVSSDIVVTLDPDGAFTVELPATDDPDVRPYRFTYEVKESFSGEKYDIAVPLGSTQNLLDVRPMQPSIGLMRYVGPAGPAGTGLDGIAITNTPTADGQILVITSLDPLEAAWATGSGGGGGPVPSDNYTYGGGIYGAGIYSPAS